MKKLVMLVLFCSLGLATIGCDSGKKPDAPKKDDPAKKADATPAPAPAPAKKN